MTETVIAAAFSILGVVAGVVLTHHFNRASEKARRTDDEKARAYADYLQAVATIAQAGKTGNSASQSKVGLADAKARLVVYADSDVLVALARLERTGAHLASDEGIAAFLDVSTAMRRSLGDRNVPPTDDIRIVLFGPDGQLRREHGKNTAGA